MGHRKFLLACPNVNKNNDIIVTANIVGYI